MKVNIKFLIYSFLPFWSASRVEMVCGRFVGLIGSWVSVWVRLVRGSEWFMGWFVGPIGSWVSAWFVGIDLVCGYRCGCAVVRGYRRGSICLISVKFCYGLISDLVWLFCFVFFFLNFFFCYCGLWLWLVGQQWRWLLLLCWFLWWLFIIILMNYLYYFNELLKI